MKLPSYTVFKGCERSLKAGVPLRQARPPRPAGALRRVTPLCVNAGRRTSSGRLEFKLSRPPF